jgi:hypothetical protein
MSDSEPKPTFEQLYQPLPLYLSFEDGINMNGDEFVGNGNDVSVDQQIIYPWEAVGETQPPGSG